MDGESKATIYSVFILGNIAWDRPGKPLFGTRGSINIIVSTIEFAKYVENYKGYTF